MHISDAQKTPFSVDQIQGETRPKQLLACMHLGPYATALASTSCLVQSKIALVGQMQYTYSLALHEPQRAQCRGSCMHQYDFCT